MIKKIKITAGVYWIEVESIGVKILCASPNDSVKYMMKGGLIQNIEKDGISLESGPNYILLSDLMIQNSQFSNLAEFPVLQMLYKQGMIIPNHPGNNGRKPTLIGSVEQVDIQMEYIYRGNYGLDSIEEIMQAGIDKDYAKELMDIKLKFAFGKLKKSHELLDKIYLNDHKVEIKDGLSIKRISTNKFEFTYNDSHVKVDLNLDVDEEYSTTYHLGLTNFRREYFSIIHTGEGDGWDIKRPCMGSIITFQGKIYLIDAGPNIDATLNALGISVNEIEGIFHTHAHDDHFAGITSLIQSDHKLKYYSSSLVRASVFKKLSTLLSIEVEKLDNFFDYIDLELDEWNNIDGLEIKPVLSPHPVETNILFFRVLGDNGYKSYAHLADICSFDTLDSLESKDGGIGISLSKIDKIKESYLEEVDVKKIDNGGGMIHGIGSDFSDDKSKKLMLSHSAQPLTRELKQIGSGAPFGSIDILIEAKQDYSYEYANNYLGSYFPNVPRHWIKVLLNNPMKLFNPETIIIKQETIPDSVYMIVTGNVEMIHTQEGVFNILSSGAIFGDFSGIHATKSPQTFRASSYVKALTIPASQYLSFIRENSLYADMEKLNDRRSFLESTWLFGESISYAQLNKITHNLIKKRYQAGEVIDDKCNTMLKIIIKGSIIKYLDNKEISIINAGEFIGENLIIYGEMSNYNYVAKDNCTIVSIDKQFIDTIPIIFWKLYVTNNKREKKFEN